MTSTFDMLNHADEKRLAQALTPHAHGTGDHFVHFYEGDGQLGDAVADFLAPGLLAGDPSIIVTTELHRTHILDRLAARGVDVGSVCGAGQLLVHEVGETLAKFMVGSLPSRELFLGTVGRAIEGLAARYPGRHVRAYGEMVDVLWRANRSQAAIELEQMWNDLQRSHSFSLLCAYVMANLYEESSDLHRVCAAHSQVFALDQAGRPLGAGPALVNERMQHGHALVAEIAQRKLVEGALRDSLEQLSAARARLELLHAEGQQARRGRELLCGLAASIGRARDLDEVFLRALDAVEQALDTQRASIMTLDAEGVMRFRAWRGLSEQYRRGAEGYCSLTSQERAPEPTQVEDVEREASLSSHLPVIRAERIGALSRFPMSTGDRVIGELAVYFARPRQLTAAELSVATAIANQAAIAIARFQSRAELNNAIRFHEMFTGILGHALRNPLAAIMSGAYLALNRTDREELALPLTRIATNGERLVRMIDQLLDFNRVQIGAGMPIESSRSDLAQALGQVVDELDDTNPDCVISLDHAGGETEGDWDADRLAQVFSNLLANAVRHGDREHGVQVCIDGKQPDLVRIEIHNRGAIPENLVPKLFEPLAGGERRRDQAEGLGLGLHISHEIVKAHHGQIEVRSSEAEGTTFAVLLPRTGGLARMQLGSTPTVASAL